MQMAIKGEGFEVEKGEQTCLSRDKELLEAFLVVQGRSCRGEKEEKIMLKVMVLPEVEKKRGKVRLAEEKEKIWKKNDCFTKFAH